MYKRTKVLIIAIAAVMVVSLLAFSSVDDYVHDYDYDYDAGFEDGTYEYPYQLGPRDPERIFPSTVTDDDKVYLEASVAEKKENDCRRNLEKALSSGHNSAEMMAQAILDAEKTLADLSDDRAWVEAYYNLDPIGMRAVYSDWMNLNIGDAHDVVTDATYGPLGNRVKEALRILGRDPADYRWVPDGSHVDYDRINRLEAKVNELILDYNASINAGADVDTILEIYIDLVDTRNDIAKLYGFKNYMEYCYEAKFGREYGPGDVDGFFEILDEAKYLKSATYSAVPAWELMFEYPSWFYSLKYEQMLGYMSPFLADADPYLKDLLIQMYQCGLMLTDDVSGHLSGAYTTRLSESGGSLIVAPGASLTTLVHEFGHASNFSLNPDRSDCSDVYEIHSQGLEMLFSSYMRGEVEGSRVLDIMAVRDMVGAVIDSCYMTTFENWAYETEAQGAVLTVESILKKYAEITGSDDTRHLTHVHHLYDSPGYYISYGTSALNALELWNMAYYDYDAALDTYLDLLYQEGTDGYVAAVEAVGLSNMLLTENAEGVIKDTLSILEVYA